MMRTITVCLFLCFLLKIIDARKCPEGYYFDGDSYKCEKNLIEDSKFYHLW